MAIQTTRRVVVAVTLSVIVAALALTVMATGVLTSNRSLQSFGTVQAVGVGVYWNSACTNVTSTVNWGFVPPGASKNVTLYVRNEGTVPVVLSLTTNSWNPSNAASYIGLAWNREGAILNAGFIASATLILSISSSISGISTFSFNIVITGTQQ